MLLLLLLVKTSITNEVKTKKITIIRIVIEYWNRYNEMFKNLFYKHINYLPTHWWWLYIMMIRFVWWSCEGFSIPSSVEITKKNSQWKKKWKESFFLPLFIWGYYILAISTTENFNWQHISSLINNWNIKHKHIHTHTTLTTNKH